MIPLYTLDWNTGVLESKRLLTPTVVLDSTGAVRSGDDGCFVIARTLFKTRFQTAMVECRSRDLPSHIN